MPDLCVRVETRPVGGGYEQQLTTTYAGFRARWATRMSWTEAAFHTTWAHVFRSVEMAVAWGREHRALDGIRPISEGAP